jgi:hypothetical protein
LSGINEKSLNCEQVIYLLTNCDSIVTFHCDGFLSNTDILNIFGYKNNVNRVIFQSHNYITADTIITVIAWNKQLKFVHCMVGCFLVDLKAVQMYITENKRDVQLIDKFEKEF